MTAAVKPAYEFDYGQDDAYPPDLYQPEATATQLPDLDAIDEAQLGAYREHGHLSVAQAISPAAVQEALAAIDDLVAGRNPEFNGVMFENAARNGVSELDARARFDHVRKLAWFVKFDERLNRLAHDPALLRALSRLMGGKEPRLFQDMALLKPPKIGREKPWHQDHAYFDLELTDQVVGVWIALDEATVDNGCMQVLDGGHKAGPILHWKRRDWQICDNEMVGRTSVACPLPPGGALFFDSFLPHGTPKNDSPHRRRALQLHYCTTDASKVPTERRLAVFGTDGKDVTC